MTNTIHPVLLVILDGWGYSENHEHNAIAQANTPHWDNYWQHYPQPSRITNKTGCIVFVIFNCLRDLTAFYSADEKCLL